MVQPRPMPARKMLLRASRDDLLAERLPALRAALESQRDFRREQLARLDVPEWSGSTSTAPAGVQGPADDTTVSCEVRALVEAGARRALDDIELALDRIRTGGYGRCRACDVDIALAVIEAIPRTTLCLRCAVD